VRTGTEKEERGGRTRKKEEEEGKIKRKKRRVKNYLQRPEPGKHNCVQIE
jgi:hypothetical protein